jgi:hypothetical protein
MWRVRARPVISSDNEGHTHEMCCRSSPLGARLRRPLAHGTRPAPHTGPSGWAIGVTDALVGIVIGWSASAIKRSAAGVNGPAQPARRSITGPSQVHQRSIRGPRQVYDCGRRSPRAGSSGPPSPATSAREQVLSDGAFLDHPAGGPGYMGGCGRLRRRQCPFSQIRIIIPNGCEVALKPRLLITERQRSRRHGRRPERVFSGQAGWDCRGETSVRVSRNVGRSSGLRLCHQCVTSVFGSGGVTSGTAAGSLRAGVRISARGGGTPSRRRWWPACSAPRPTQ